MKLPSFQFYPGDWRKDENLSRCSLQAKGALIEIMCLAFQCEKRGVLISGGKPWTIDDISLAIGGDFSINKTAIEELLQKHVLKKDKKGAIFSKRMVKDAAIINKRIEGGKLGAVHGLKGKEHGKKGGRPVINKKSNPPHIPPNNPPLQSSSSSSSSTSVNTDTKQHAFSESEEEAFLNNQILNEQFCMTKGISMANLIALKKEFVGDLKLKGEPIRDIQAHFLNWFNKRLTNGSLTNFLNPGKKSMTY